MLIHFNGNQVSPGEQFSRMLAWASVMHAIEISPRTITIASVATKVDKVVRPIASSARLILLAAREQTLFILCGL